MRKILLGIILLALVVGISYLKSVRALDRDQDSYEKGRTEVQAEAVEQANAADSLREVLGQKEVEHANIMIQQEIEHSVEVDSLKCVIDVQQMNLAAQPKSAPPNTDTAINKKPAPPTFEEKVLNYYKAQYETLPSDLSSYEKKIAIGELREKTAAKFKITLEQMNKIRRDSKLNY